MARKFLITCDGCGAETGGADSTDGPLRVEVALPLLGAATFSVEVRHGGARALDLCGGCKWAICGQARLTAADAEKEGPAPKTRPVCAACGSGNVRATAQVAWDENLQAWVKDPDDDGWESWCDDCGNGHELREEGLDG